MSLTCPQLESPQSYGFSTLWESKDSLGSPIALPPKENRIIRASDGQLTFSPLMQDDCTYFRNNKFVYCQVEAANEYFESSNTYLTCSAVTSGKCFLSALFYVVYKVPQCVLLHYFLYILSLYVPFSYRHCE